MDPPVRDPALGTPAEFKAFVDACHAAGIKVMLDVIGHGLVNESHWVAEHPQWFAGGSWGMTDVSAVLSVCVCVCGGGGGGARGGARDEGCCPYKAVLSPTPTPTPTLTLTLILHRAFCSFTLHNSNRTRTHTPRRAPACAVQLRQCRLCGLVGVRVERLCPELWH
jgi:hypothetical protein